MDLGPAILFALSLGSITLGSASAANQFGEESLYAIAFVTGLADVDAVTVSAAKQKALETISLHTSSWAVFIAVAMNVFAKIFVCLGIAGSATMRRVVGGILAAGAVGTFISILRLA